MSLVRVRLLLAATVLIATASCHNGRPARIELGVQGAVLREPTTITLELSSCLAKDRRVTVAETAKRVAVTVTAKNPGRRHKGFGPACLDLAQVKLKAPLGNRALVVGTGHRVIVVRGRDSL